MQVRNGMSGAISVDGLLDPFPTLRHVRERVILLKDLQIKDGRVVHLDIGKNTIRTINGIVNPVIVLRPGETELWRIGNVGADLYYLLTLDGHHFQMVGRDGNRRAHLTPLDTLRLSPGARIGVLVTAGAPGVYLLRTGDIDTGPAGNRYAGTVMATVRVEGSPATPVALPPALLPVEDLRGKITNRRTIVLSESQDGDTMFIDRKQFDMSRTDTRVKLGAVPAHGDQRRSSTGRRPPRHRRRAHQRRGEGHHPFHESDDPRPVRLPLPHSLARGQRHDGNYRGNPVAITPRRSPAALENPLPGLIGVRPRHEIRMEEMREQLRKGPSTAV